jgi:hypothetical protein
MDCRRAIFAHVAFDHLRFARRSGELPNALIAPQRINCHAEHVLLDFQ